MRAYLIVLLLLTGCATAEQQAAKQAAYKERLIATCDGFGFVRDTDGHRNCQLQFLQMEAARRSALGAAAYGASLQRMQQPTSVTCNTLGNTTSCH